jgi:hypothetical protein
VEGIICVLTKLKVIYQCLLVFLFNVNKKGTHFEVLLTNYIHKIKGHIYQQIKPYMNNTRPRNNIFTK